MASAWRIAGSGMPRSVKQITAWAADDFRSINGTIRLAVLGVRKGDPSVKELLES